MTDLPGLANPVWHALTGAHRHLAVRTAEAGRYPAAVAPFAAVGRPTDAALAQLRSMLVPGETVWIAAPGRPLIPGLALETELDCVQMLLARDAPAPPIPAGLLGAEVVALGASDAPEMVALTDLAFPGFFRPQTHRMGAYVGVRSEGRLIAMAGERLRLAGGPELSGICTHPAHRGRGLATVLIAHLVARHRRDGLISWLHVGAANTRAIDLYEGLGFRAVGTLRLQRIAAQSAS